MGKGNAMYYWFSSVANSYYVLDENKIVKGGYLYSSNVLKDYPNARFCKCDE
jgi:hypothetical protein